MLDRFYPIVDSATWIERLLLWGARCIQLRIKDLTIDEIREEVRRSQRLCTHYRAQLIVNDHWQVALDEHCDFVHLGHGDLEGADVAALRRASVRMGISTHDHAELERALALQPDYVALGPIYPTSLKQMPWAPQGLERIGEWKRHVGSRPLVAIGGLTVERLAGVFAAGADSAAVVSDVVNHVDPQRRVHEWLAATRQST